MKRKLILLPLAGMALAAPVQICAQNEHLVMSMDDAQEAKDDLLDAVNAAQGPKAAEAVRKITKIILEIKMFWEEQKQADVVKLADDTLAAAAEMDKVARSGNMANAKAVYAKLDMSCQQCHNVHPENRIKK